MNVIINKVTTKTGDKGLTLGPGCKKYLKNAPEINFEGNLDLLNALIGETNTYIEDKEKEFIRKIQNDIFDIGANFYKQEDINSSYINKLDEFIENYQKNLAPLTSFLIPQGSQKNIKLHILRAFTRQVERSFYDVKNYAELNNIGVYLNRLSDVFFILLRDQKEVLWKENNEL